jgi:hypothetical protein
MPSNIIYLKETNKTRIGLNELTFSTTPPSNTVGAVVLEAVDYSNGPWDIIVSDNVIVNYTSNEYALKGVASSLPVSVERMLVFSGNSIYAPSRFSTGIDLNRVTGLNQYYLLIEPRGYTVDVTTNPTISYVSFKIKVPSGTILVPGANDYTINHSLVTVYSQVFVNERWPISNVRTLGYTENGRIHIVVENQTTGNITLTQDLLADVLVIL